MSDNYNMYLNMKIMVKYIQRNCPYLTPNFLKHKGYCDSNIENIHIYNRTVVYTQNNF